MLNNILLVGRLVRDVEVEELENGGKKARICLAVNRSYKNAEGIYETDFIDCVLFEHVVQSISEYCKKGDIIGIRGRLQSRNIEKEDGSKVKVLEVVAEKVTFLSSRKSNEE